MRPTNACRLEDWGESSENMLQPLLLSWHFHLYLTLLWFVFCYKKQFSEMWKNSQYLTVYLWTSWETCFFLFITGKGITLTLFQLILIKLSLFRACWLFILCTTILCKEGKFCICVFNAHSSCVLWILPNRYSSILKIFMTLAPNFKFCKSQTLTEKIN
jgi:hypothetical protein